MAVNQPLHLKPEMRVCSTWACGKVNNTCCSGFVSPSLLRVFNCVSPHYERENDGVCQCSCRFSRTSPLSVGLLLNTKLGMPTNQKLLTRLVQERSRDCNAGPHQYLLRQIQENVSFCAISSIWNQTSFQWGISVMREDLLHGKSFGKTWKKIGRKISALWV